MNRRMCATYSLCLLSLLIALAGCGGSDDAGKARLPGAQAGDEDRQDAAPRGEDAGPDGGGSDVEPEGDDEPLYAVFTSVATVDDDSTSYLAITDSLDGTTELDTKQAIEVPGASRFYAPEAGGFFALGSNEDLSITRYDVSKDGEFEETGRVSFAGVGVTRLHYRAAFLSETKAYYIDHTQAQIVIWNPRDMTIDGTITLPEEIADGYEGYTSVLPYFRMPVVQGRLFIPVAWHVAEAGTARDVTGLVVVDTKTDSVLSFTETDRCAGATELAFDDNGDVYYGTNVNQPYGRFAHDPKLLAENHPGCILRIRAGEQDFDPEYILRLEEVVGDRTSMGLADGAAPGIGYVQVIDEDKLAWADVKDEDTFWGEAVWDWWKVDLATGEAERDTEIPISAPFMTSYQVDGRRYVARQTGDNSSRLFELRADGQHLPGLSSVGEIRGIARVR